MKLKRLICLSLCVLAVCSCALSGCSGNGATPDEISTTATADATTVTATEAETTGVKDTQDETTETVPTKPDKPDNKKPDKNTTNNSSSDTKKPASNSSNSNSSAGNNSYPSSSAKKCTITAGNQGYVKSVGDTVKYCYYLKTPKKIENIQAQLTYDSSMLKLKETSAEKMFPVMGSSVMYNTAIKDVIKFNASNISGYDFTKKGQLIVAEFEVLKTGGTTIATAIEFMDEKGGVPYVDDLKIVGDITIEEAIIN